MPVSFSTYASSILIFSDAIYTAHRFCYFARIRFITCSLRLLITPDLSIGLQMACFYLRFVYLFPIPINGRHIYGIITTIAHHHTTYSTLTSLAASIILSDLFVRPLSLFLVVRHKSTTLEPHEIYHIFKFIYILTKPLQCNTKLRPYSTPRYIIVRRSNSFTFISRSEYVVVIGIYIDGFMSIGNMPYLCRRYFYLSLIYLLA